jgi:hypothetical protein
MYHVTGNGGLQAVYWDSVAEPMQMVSAEWNLPENANRAAYYATREADESWYGAPTRAVLDERLAQGWPEGVERLMQLATREINPSSIRRRRERADQGAELDIHAVYRGDLSRAWTRSRRKASSTARSISLVIDLAANCDITADQLFWRGAAALRLVSALTDAGYSVAVFGVAAGQGVDTESTVNVCQMVSIKDEDQPLDLDRLAALTAMPGFFRTSLFVGIVKCADLAGKHACGSLGYANQKHLAAGVALLPIPQNVIVQEPVLDQKSAEAWIDKVLAQLEGA